MAKWSRRFDVVRRAALGVLLTACGNDYESRTADATEDSPQPDAQVMDAAAPPADLGCVDIWVDAKNFPHDGELQLRWQFPGLKTFAVDERGVHFVDHILHRKAGDDWERLPGDVGLVTYDRETGELLRLRLLDAFPAGFCTNCRDIADFALAPSGAYAILIGYEGADPGQPTGWRLVVGHLDREPFSVVDPGWGPGSRGHAVDWDGEAFAVHGNVASEGAFGWSLTRVGEDGHIVAPARFLSGWSTSEVQDMRYAVDAESGRSYVLNEPVRRQDSMYLCGHERDGSPLPAVPDGCFSFGPVHQEMPRGTYPGIQERTQALGLSGGRPFEFMSPHGRNRPNIEYAVFAAGPEGDTEPPVVRVFFPFDAPRDTQPLDWRGSVLVEHPGADWPWVITKTELGIERKTFGDAGLEGSEVIVWSPADRCWRFHDCPVGAPSTEFGLSRLQALSTHGDVWIAFGDGVDQPPEECFECAPNRGIHRIVRAAPGCQYLKARDAVAARKRRDESAPP